MLARRSLFIRGLFCTLLVAFPALAEPITGLDDIKLGADRTLRLAVRPEARCVLGDLDAIALEMKKMAQERAEPAATNILLTIEPLAGSSFPPVVKSISQGEVNPKQGASFVLPRTPDWTHAGVFICMAQGRQGEAPAATRRSCRTTRCSKTTAWTSIIRPARLTNVPVPGLSKTRFTSLVTSSCTKISSPSLPNP